MKPGVPTGQPKLRLKLKKLKSPSIPRRQVLRHSVWHIIPDGTIADHFTFGNLLGKGAIGHVFSAVDCSDGSNVAVKVVKTAQLNKVQRDDLEREVDILSHLQHTNVIHLKSSFRDSIHCYLVMQLVQGNELFEKIVNSGHIQEPVAQGIIWQLATALAYLHAKGIAHRDVKPENVMINVSPFKVTLADFGLSVKIHSSSPAALRRFCGTPLYIAPEIVCRATHGFKADVYSLGVLLYVVLTGEPPFDDESNEALFDSIRNGSVSLSSPLWLDGVISEDAKDLVQKMMEIDPVKRLSAQQVLGHKWFSRLAAQPKATTVTQSETILQSDLRALPSSRVTKTRMLQRKRTQSFAKFSRVVSKCYSLLHDFPTNYQQQPVTTQPKRMGNRSTSCCGRTDGMNKTKSPSSAKTYESTLPSKLNLTQFCAWVAQFNLDQKEGILAFKLLDYDNNNMVDGSEIRRALLLAQNMCRSTLQQWVQDLFYRVQLSRLEIQPSNKKLRSSLSGKTSMETQVTLSCVQEAIQAAGSQFPKCVADAVREVFSEFSDTSSGLDGQLISQIDQMHGILIPVWMKQAVLSISRNPQVALHFLFNPELNSSWSNDDHQDVLKYIGAKKTESIIQKSDAADPKHDSQQSIETPHKQNEQNHKSTSEQSSNIKVKSAITRLASSPSSTKLSSPYHPVRVRDRLLKRQLLVDLSARVVVPGLRKRDIVMESLDTVCTLTNAERCTVFLLSDDCREVVSFVLGGTKLAGSSKIQGAMPGDENYTCIRVAIGEGIAGTVALTGESLIINNPNSDPRWNSRSDHLTGFHTHNMICVPLTTWKVEEKSNSSEVSRDEYIIGCVQVLNSLNADGFNEVDLGWLEEWKTVIGVELAAAHDHQHKL